jgi:hypothetical protein
MSEIDIADRWRQYRRARERGESEARAYDRYLHPRTRISDSEFRRELGVVDGSQDR